VGLTIRRLSGVVKADDIGAMLTTFHDEASLALSGGLARSALFKVDVTRPPEILAESKWSGEWAGPGRKPGVEYRVRAQGTFDPSTQAGSVRKVEVAQWRDGQAQWTTTYEVEMAPRARGQLPATVRVVHRSAPDAIVRTLVLLTAEPVSDEVVQALAARPPLQGTDQVRGALTYRSISDELSAAQRVTTTLLDDGTTHSSAMEMPGARPSMWLRYIGWSIVALIAATLVAIKLRRNAAKGASA
jgi:hypothetical protein